MKTNNNNIKRWTLPRPINEDKIHNINLNYTLQKVLIRRGIDIRNELEEYLSPSELPDPEDHFSDLCKATKRIIKACERNEMIAVCGDYDADGITSTVLLVELLSIFGASVKPYIPSRQEDGYGLNLNMLNQINNHQISLIITVDNGISAFEAIKKAKELGIDLIITDHHKIPDNKVDIFSLIHPEKTPLNSPYRYLAGVGIAYLLAKNICNKLSFDIDDTTANVFFCIGTVADMAPLKGANRKWLKECLPKINRSTNKGVKSIMKKLSIHEKDISVEDIGYKIAPLINAVGRIDDPKILVDLFVNESNDSVNKLTNKCFLINKERKRITGLVEQEVLEIAESDYNSGRKFLVITNRNWHIGIIGIVAARMVDKFNLPTAILGEANDGYFRGSIRSNNKLNVNNALKECKDLLVSYGGHSAAAGFSIKEENIHKLRERLNVIANREFSNIKLTKSIKPDAHIRLDEINYDFYKQLMLIGPFGIMNPSPIFWTRKCRVLDIYTLKGCHLKMKLDDGTSTIDAIKWNESIQLKIGDLIDIAFYIEINSWKRINKYQLNLIDIKTHKKVVDLHLHNRIYKCEFTKNQNILITNAEGQCISSDISSNTVDLDINQKIFAKKILNFAEIALGKAA